MATVRTPPQKTVRQDVIGGRTDVDIDGQMRQRNDNCHLHH
jgi:hypothetical protein